MVKLRYGHGDQTAATIASISQILPIFVAPFQGYFHDRYGRRATIAILASLTFILSMWIFLEHTNIEPAIGMIIFSISLTFGPVAMFSSVPLTLAKAFVGTGIGIYKSSLYTGTSLFDIFVGILQDYGRHQKEKTGHGDEYEPVLKLYVVLGLIGLIFAVFVYLADSRRKLESGTRYSIFLDEEERTPRDEEVTLDQTTTYQSIPQDEHTSTSPNLPPVKWYSYVAISLLSVALVTSWILFTQKLITKNQ
jgi:MFS family permease